MCRHRETELRTEEKRGKDWCVSVSAPMFKCVFVSHRLIVFINIHTYVCVCVRGVSLNMCASVPRLNVPGWVFE